MPRGKKCENGPSPVLELRDVRAAPVVVAGDGKDGPEEEKKNRRRAFFLFLICCCCATMAAIAIGVAVGLTDARPVTPLLRAAASASPARATVPVLLGAWDFDDAGVLGSSPQLSSSSLTFLQPAAAPVYVGGKGGGAALSATTWTASPNGLCACADATDAWNLVVSFDVLRTGAAGADAGPAYFVWH
jgi:hypothetical protein